MIALSLLLEEDDPVLKFAAGELAAHLNLLPIKGGRGNEAEEEPYSVNLRIDRDICPTAKDGFYYEFTKRSGLIAGSNSRSVLLGVYGYLQQIGFVFCYPGKEGTYVPNITCREGLLSVKVCRTACLHHRGVCIEGADSLENVLDFIDWLPKTGFNSFFIQFKKPDIFFERWYEHIFNPLLNKEEKTRKELDAMEEALTQAIRKRGLIEHRVGHGWTAEVLGFPSAGWQMKEAVTNPEIEALIAEVSGKKETWKGIPANTNLCYANDRVKKALVDKVVSYAKAHKNVDYLHFWLADDYNNVCECEECVKTTIADQYVAILNEMDRRLTAEGLSVKIVFLLYQELLYAPLYEKIHHSGRFCLMFAPISRTFERSYPRTISPVPIEPYVRNRMKLPETVEENLTHYLNWKEQFAKDSFFYDYPLGRAHYGDFGYMKIARVIYDDIHALKALHTDGYMSCQELRVMTPHGFPNYVMGQALFDESLPYEEMKKTYFRAMYGNGYEAVIDYLEHLSELSDTDYFNGHGPRVQPLRYIPYINIEKAAREFLENLDIMGEKEPRYKRNLEYLNFHAHYCILLSRSLAALCVGDQETADERFREFCQFIQEKELQVQPMLDVYRVIEVATRYTGFSSLS